MGFAMVEFLQEFIDCLQYVVVPVTAVLVYCVT